MIKKSFLICLLSILLLSCNKKLKNDLPLLNQLKAGIIKASNEHKPLYLPDFTDFDWDLLYIIHPYSTDEMLKNLTSVKELNFDTSIMYSDTISLLLFSKSNRIVKILEYPRNLGDFACLSSTKFSRSETFFEILAENNWLSIKEINFNSNNGPIPLGYQLQRKVLPELVLEIFYKIKDSLDYGNISAKGLTPSEKKKPGENISEYSRIDERFLSELQKEFLILSYEYTDSNYELIIINQHNHSRKFKASRKNIYTWENNTWIDLGGYFYL